MIYKSERISVEMVRHVYNDEGACIAYDGQQFFDAAKTDFDAEGNYSHGQAVEILNYNSLMALDPQADWDAPTAEDFYAVAYLLDSPGWSEEYQAWLDSQTANRGFSSKMRF